MLTWQDYVAKPAECECPEIPDSLLPDLGMHGSLYPDVQATTGRALRSHVFSTLPQRLACAFSNNEFRSLEAISDPLLVLQISKNVQMHGFSPPLIALSSF